MNNVQIVKSFKDKLDSSITQGSKDVRLSRDEYVKLTVALSNLLLENSQLRETNRMISERLYNQETETEIVVDGGGF